MSLHNHLNFHEISQTLLTFTTLNETTRMMPMRKSPMWGMQQPRYNKAPSKVVSIPVHFVGSERSRSESATKIQKVVRGFLVRNSVKKMKAMRVELEQIEKKVNAPESVELMRKDERERVRVSETIMNLLLRLDSVRVLHYSALRDCRKSLIKKAIALQEMVDQIQPHTTQAQDSASSEMIEGEKMEALGNEEEGKCVEEESVEEEKGEVGCEEHVESEKMEGLRKEEKMEVEEKEDECVEEESVGTSLEEEEDEEENCLEKEEKGGVVEYDDRNRELLERMMEDNEKMMKMMQQLFQRNEMQTRFLSSLSQRVEQLERAFACDKFRRKKRRNANVDAKHKETDPKNGCI